MSPHKTHVKPWTYKHNDLNKCQKASTKVKAQWTTQIAQNLAKSDQINLFNHSGN